MTQIINPSLISDNNTFKFKTFENQIDVYYNNERVAIINGVSSALQWTAKNGSNIPVIIIDQLESLVIELVKKSLISDTIKYTEKDMYEAFLAGRDKSLNRDEYIYESFDEWNDQRLTEEA